MPKGPEAPRRRDSIAVPLLPADAQSSVRRPCCRSLARRRWGCMVALAFLGVAITVGLVSPASAHGSGFPNHRMRGVECVPFSFLGNQQRQLRVYPPSVMHSWRAVDFRRAEQVSWRPVVYRYDAGRRAWILYSNAAGWTSAFTSSYGFYGIGWRSRATGGQIQFFPLNVTAGSYTVLHKVHWSSSDVYHDEWAPNACTFG